MQGRNAVCPICGEKLAAGVRVALDDGEMLHLTCFSATERTAVLVQNFLVSRPSQSFCYPCLADHLIRDHREVEKAATALRVTRNRVVGNHGYCSACDHVRLTIRAEPVR
jgi:hypothetical protein